MPSEELVQEIEQRGNEHTVDLGCPGSMKLPHGDVDVPQMTRRRRECGPRGKDGAAVQQAVELIRDILLGGALTGESMTHIESSLPAGVQQSKAGNVLRFDDESVFQIPFLVVFLNQVSIRLDLGGENEHVNPVAQPPGQMEKAQGLGPMGQIEEAQRLGGRFNFGHFLLDLTSFAKQ